MTQYSFFWGCGTSGDQGNVTLDKMRWAQMLLGNSTPDESGVVYWNQAITPPAFDTGVSFSGPVDGLLEPSNPSGSIVRVASGIGMVQGSIYFNDANVDFDISSDLGAASATDLIVLERSASSSEVRIARVKGSAGSIATVTQTTATWQVALARVVLTAGGDFSSLEDVRKIAHSPAGSSVKVHESIGPFSSPLTISNIPPLFSSLEITFVLRTDVGADSDTAILSLNTTPGEPLNIMSTELTLGNVFTNSASSTTDPAFFLEITGDTSPAGASTHVSMSITGADSELDKSILYNSVVRVGTLAADTKYVNAGIVWQTSAKLEEIGLASLSSSNFSEGSRVVIRGII